LRKNETLKTVRGTAEQAIVLSVNLSPPPPPHTHVIILSVFTRFSLYPRKVRPSVCWADFDIPHYSLKYDETPIPDGSMSTV
jgi:hypothetical protein